MTKLGRFLTTVVIGGFAAILIVLIALSVTRESVPVQRTLAEALESMDKTNLNTAGVAVQDIYGEQWKAFTTVCPGTTEEEISSFFQVEPDTLGIETPVAENDNYILAFNEDEEFFAEKLDREHVDLCPSGRPLPLSDTLAIAPFVKVGSHTWVLAV